MQDAPQADNYRADIQANIAKDVSLTDLIRQVITWFVKNLRWMLGGIILGAAIGALIAVLTPKQYVSLMVGYSNNMNDVRVREIVSDLQSLKVTGQSAELSQRLGLSEKELAVIKSFDTQWHEALEADLPNYPPREVTVRFFGIAVTLFDPSIAPKVGEAILHYFDNLPISRNVLRTQQANHQKMVDDCLREMAYLEEIKNDQRQLLTRNGAYIGDPGATSIHMLELSQRLGDEREKVKRYAHELVIFKPMESNLRPITPGPYRGAASGAVFGLIASIALFLFRGARQLVRQ